MVTNQSLTQTNIQLQWFIQSASVTSSNGSISGYDSWSPAQSITPANDWIFALTSIPSTDTRGTSRNIVIGGVSNSNFNNYQGQYVRVYAIVRRTSNGDMSDILKLKNFVYRTSRAVGSSILPPLNPIIQF